MENAAHIGLPIPEKLKEILAQLHNRGDKESLPDATNKNDEGDGE